MRNNGKVVLRLGFAAAMMLFAFLPACHEPEAHCGAERRARRVQVTYDTIGQSVECRAIEAATFGRGRERVLIFAGIHGDEPQSVLLARRLIDLLAAEPQLADGRRVTIVPVANPDGLGRGTRRNANCVDVNRNFPAKNWELGDATSRYFGGERAASEPETAALMSLIRKLRPARIVSIHTISDGKHCNNYDGPARELAEAMAEGNGYPVAASIGYPTPGSFGTWAGVEGGVPTITLELPSNGDPEEIWTRNRPALLAFVAYDAANGECRMANSE